MDYKSVSNHKGLSLELVRGANDYFTFMGGDSSNPSWEEYVADFKSEFQDHVKLIRKSIEENGLVGEKGEFANDLSFKFSDGQHWGFTWRAWGDLMSAIVDKREGYIAYYM